jgi:uncharacterized Ntn-hydrolase superfamily protein
MTFSILGYDPESGESGGAVQSKFPGVGTIVLHGRAGAGCVATQAFSNPAHGPKALDLMELGANAGEVLSILTRKDERLQERQIAIVDGQGHTACMTGEEVKG